MFYAYQRTTNVLPTYYQRSDQRSTNGPPTVHQRSAIEVNNQFDKLFIPKKKIQRVTPQAEKVFIAAIYAYNKQLEQLEKIKRATDDKSFVSIPKLDFNTGVLRGFKEHGLPLIDLGGKSLLGHRKRLQEANVFRANENHGSKRGVTVHINNQILTVYCKFHLKYYNLDNQLDSLQGRKKLPDNNILTINKYNIINKEERSSLPLTSKKLLITGTPTSKVDKKNQAAEKKPKDLNQRSEFLRLFLFSPEDLGRKLAAGDYYKEPKITRNDLINEMRTGDLSRTEYKTLLVNYMMMQFSKFYEGKTPYASSWTSAIYDWLDYRYVNKNGSMMNKDTMLGYFFMYDTAYIEVFGYLKAKPDFNLLYPNLYFDCKSKSQYAFKNWSKKRLSNLDKTTQEYTAKHKPTAKTKNQQAMYLKRLKVWVHGFLNGSKSLEDVYYWANRNTTKEFSINIDKHISSIVEDWNTNRNAA